MQKHNVRDAQGRFTKQVVVTQTAKPTKKKASTPTKTTAPKKQLKQYVAFVVDESGSMGWIAKQTVTSVSAMYNAVEDIAKKQNIETEIAIYTFRNNQIKRTESIQELNRIYYPAGGTPLYDAIGQCVEDFNIKPDANDANVSFLVYVVTDGDENSSFRYNANSISALLKASQSTEKWSFGFNVPKGYKHHITKLGVPEGNIREWNTDAEGVKEVAQVTAQSLGTFYNERVTKGATKSVDLYTTDLSNVSTKDITSKLTDLSDRFKSFEVTKETNITEFIESKTKADYVLGQGYFLLMKPEKLRIDKQIIIQEKGKKAVWGGSEARDVIGLPKDKEVKVVPGNHANFDIYVQSGSVNRILPRGTKVFIDMKQTKAIKETWDSKAAEAAKLAKEAEAAKLAAAAI